MATTDTQQVAQFSAEAAVSAAEAKQYLIEAQQGYQDTSAAAQEAKDAAAAAATSEQNTTYLEANAAQSAAAAEDAKADAEAAASSASDYAKNKFTFYKTPSDPDGTIAGLAATTDNQSFWVAQGPDALSAAWQYQNKAGVAVLQAKQPGTAAISATIRQFPTLSAAQDDAAAGNILNGAKCWVTNPSNNTLADEYINNSGTIMATGNVLPSEDTIERKIDERLVPGSYLPDWFPVFFDQRRNVYTWFDGGRWDVADFGPNARTIIESVPNAWAQKFLPQGEYSPNYFPFIYDKSGHVYAWFHNGMYDGYGFGPTINQYIKDLVGGGVVTSTNSFIEGDQFKFTFKRGRIASGLAGSLNVGFGMDSWAERNTIPQALINILGGEYKDPGFISCSTRTDGVMAGITLAVSNFTKYDGDNENNNAPPLYGSGPDGNAYWNNNAVGTLTWSKVTATELSLFYYDSTGSFTIAVDGGAPVTVTGTNSGTVKKYDITGLSATAHTVVVTSSGTGIVSILCMYGKNGSKTSGITVSRMGNGGAMAKDYLYWQNYITPIVTHFDLDLFFMILGTNDFRKSAGITEYVNGLQLVIDKYKAATPGICICLVSPAQCNATGAPALSEYDEAMRTLAVKNNVNFISLYQLFPKVYDNSGGAWADTLHLSDLGAYVLVRKIKDEFFQE